MNKNIVTAVTAIAAAFLLTLATLPAQAQTATGKKALVARILKLQQPGIEGLGRAMAETPAINLMDGAGAALEQRVAADKRDAVGKAIQADVKKYLDETVPLVAGRATKLAPTTIGPFLEDKFSEDELKQVASFLESAAVIKYQKLTADMQKLLQDQVLADTRSIVEPKVVALEAAILKRIEAAAK